MNELTSSDLSTLREIKRQIRYGSFGTDMIKNLVNGGYAKVVSGTPAYCMVSITPKGEEYLAKAPPPEVNRAPQ